MATEHYNLPTICGTDTIDGVNAINGLANAIDSVLWCFNSKITTIETQISAINTTINNLLEWQVTVNQRLDALEQGQGSGGGGEGSGDLTLIQQAINALEAYPNVSTLSPTAAGYDASGTVTAQTFIHEASHFGLLRVNIANASFNLDDNQSNATNPIWLLGTLPEGQRPSVNMGGLLLQTSIDIGQANEIDVTVYCYITPSGRIVIVHTARSENQYLTGQSMSTMSGDIVIPWYFAE